jgi:hypothetical protein
MGEKRGCPRERNLREIYTEKVEGGEGGVLHRAIRMPGTAVSFY